MDMFFHNTLSKKKEKFESLEKGKVKIYSCGPTVYDFAHIGNFRSFLMSDLLCRVLNYSGYEVTKVQNITDVGHLTNDDLADANGEDKILKKAQAENKDPFEIARNFEKFFVEDEAVLRIIPPAHRPRATDFVKEQIEIAKELVKKDLAYEVNGSVYFRVNKFPEYGNLSGNSLENLQAGARIEPNSEKEDPMDFALWKKANLEHLMQWDYNTGEKINLAKDIDENVQPGFPGWHIECSAMSRKLLGDSFDIHTGGEDNAFPHHECEIAQNWGVSDGKSELAKSGGVKYWMHAKHLLVDGKKMSKSKGNFFTIRDLLEKGYSGTELRFALLSAHYRSALNFTEQSLIDARNTIARIVEAKRIFDSVAGDFEVTYLDNVFHYQNKYAKALYDDLNVSEALAAVFGMINDGLKMKEEGTLEAETAAEFVNFLENDFAQIFDIFPEEKGLSDEQVAEVEVQIDLRTQARDEKDWAKSDEIRDELLEKFGVELVDEAGGTGWKVV